ncbi:hypothetical protein [Pseudomonas gorinensis]
MKYYIDINGQFLGGWDQDPPDGAIEVENPPEYADQIWISSGWGPSISKASQEESKWRDEQMLTAQQNVTAIDFGSKNVPGSAQEWKDYWLGLLGWTADNPDFPDSSKRPVAPT